MSEDVQPVLPRRILGLTPERSTSPYEALFVSRALKHRTSYHKANLNTATFCDVSTPNSHGYGKQMDTTTDIDDADMIASAGEVQRSESPLLQKLRMTPALARVRERLEIQLAAAASMPQAASDRGRDSKESPGLLRLRATPGRPVQEKRELLTRKHNEVRARSDDLNVGGGVSLWPHMDDMRLSGRETGRLLFLCAILLSVTLLLFWQVHGSLLLDLRLYTVKLHGFVRKHTINFSDDRTFDADVLRWHAAFEELLGDIGERFDTSSGRTPITYWLCVLSYVVGVSVLLYYLADNVLSTNKLSPRRIKQWMCLLTVVGCWTALMSLLFASACGLEQAVANAVHWLSEQQKHIIGKQLVATTYDRALKYWTTRYLPPTAPGTLVIFGVLHFQDLLHYVQYYSLPIFTAVLTPVLKLVVALLRVYGLIQQS